MWNRLKAAYTAFRTPSAVRSTNLTYGGVPLFNSQLAGLDADDNFTRTTFGASLAYMYVPAIKSSVDLIAKYTRSIPLKLVDEEGNELARNDGLARNADIFRMLDDARDDYEVPLVELMAYSRLLFGATFLEKVRNPYGYLKRVRWVNPNSVDIIAPRGVVSGYRYIGGDRTVTLKPDEMVYLREFHPLDDVEGYPPTLTALLDGQIVLDFGRFTIKYLDNGAQLGMMVFPKEGHEMSPQDARELREMWRERFRGLPNFFETLVSWQPLDVTQFEPVDISRPTVTSEDSERKIHKTFGVPPEMVGDTKNNPYQYSSETENNFVLRVPGPLIEDICTTLSRKILPAFERRGRKIVPDLSEYRIISDTETKTATMARDDYRAGTITLNTFRKMRGYDPLPNGNVFYIPAGGQIIPATDMGKPLALPSTLDDVVTGLVSGAPEPGVLRSGAPPNAQFSRYRYNGVTFEATIPAPSTREDKKYQRYVRFEGDERLVHWGQPNEDMERDNPQSRENFNSRHNCDAKRDPFSPGFQACWHWNTSSERDYDPNGDDALALYAYIPTPSAPDILYAQRALRAYVDDPRVSWQSAPTLHLTLCYARVVSDEAVDNMAALVNPMRVSLQPTVNPIGIFDTPDGQAVHVRLVRNTDLDALQADVYSAFLSETHDLSPYSVPGDWNPHITLAYVPDDVDVDLAALNTELAWMTDVVLSGNDVIFARDDYDPVVRLTAPEYIRAAQADGLDELRAWKKKIANKNKPSIWFETEHLPASVAFAVREQLHDGLDADRVASIFADAEAMLMDPARLDDVSSDEIRQAAQAMQQWGDG